VPKFEVIQMAEAAAKTATSRNTKRLQEYLEHIQRLQPGQAGRLEPNEGERVTTVRRRLGAAAKLAGKNLVIKRVGEEVYFWEEAPKQRRTRRSKKAGD
jgi:hypothetical protein